MRTTRFLKVPIVLGALIIVAGALNWMVYMGEEQSVASPPGQQAGRPGRTLPLAEIVLNIASTEPPSLLIGGEEWGRNPFYTPEEIRLATAPREPDPEEEPELPSYIVRAVLSSPSRKLATIENPEEEQSFNVRLGDQLGDEVIQEIGIRSVTLAGPHGERKLVLPTAGVPLKKTAPVPAQGTEGIPNQSG